MAVVPRPVFYRPIEMVYSGTLFTLDDGVDTVTVTDSEFGTGTWANTLSLAHSVCAYARNEGTFDLGFRVNEDLKIEITCLSNVDLTWNNTDLRDALGFTTDLEITADQYETATYTPTHMWLPERQRMDQNEFYRRIGSASAGTVSTDGVYSGTSMTDSTIYYRDIQFQMELATNLLISKETSSSANNYLSDRCLETFLLGALNASVTSDDSVNPRGFWFYNDVRDVILTEGGEGGLNTTEPWGENTQNIGVMFDKGNAPHVKCFCHLNDSRSIAHLAAEASLPASTQRFNTPVISFHTIPTASIPSWTYIDFAPG